MQFTAQIPHNAFVLPAKSRCTAMAVSSSIERATPILQCPQRTDRRNVAVLSAKERMQIQALTVSSSSVMVSCRGGHSRG